ncbi:hypothetical protein GA0061071_109111 [Kosakonia oryzendophytica]|uniref:Gas vesicle protein n=1 Tax=Kosakonia oryzendophytica TaxID=1005665 RepID=A0A1C4CY10_9ENTR|nr:hypothetical protein [Kosakonia oryzendophytica]AMO49371.1 Gas vesicle protein GvpU [Enterobacter sp. FY-07]TDT59727.1 hypothetical protein DFO53_1316 [Enterobacter sp. AG5470]WBT56170.1 hypothetical protein O9K67_13260 [Kosakonia oryzendophytica]SCC24094.1 hypothetical protein GA0061071_109111 [Kosakonia oryzendophytica]
MENQREVPAAITPTISTQDSALSHLVSCANLGAGMVVTLVVDGQVVAGELVSGQEYALFTAKAIRSVPGDESVTNSIARFFDDLAEDYRVDDDHVIPLNYLHIKDPSWMTGNAGWTSVKGTILRVHIAKVSGFSLGKAKNA